MGTPTKDPVLVAGGGLVPAGDRVVQEKQGLFREERSSAPCEPM